MDKIKEDIRGKLGLIHYLYGPGRGKTTSSFGLVIRAYGHGLKPVIIQFMKRSGNNSDIDKDIEIYARLPADISDLIDKYFPEYGERYRKLRMELDRERKVKKERRTVFTAPFSKPSMSDGNKKTAPFVYGEFVTLFGILGIPMIQLGDGSFLMPGRKPGELLVKRSGFGLELIGRLLGEEGVDLLILDEINTAVDVGLIREEDLVTMLKNKRKNIEVVLTGRPAILSLMEIADYITYFEEKRHPFRKGIYAREGIEY